MASQRVDKLLVERGLAPSRERAQALIMAGCVRSGSRRIEKAGERLPEDAELSVEGADHPYVGRGGVKLAHALTHFAIDVTEQVALDVGASTGGFTDCLLQRGIRKVYAVDVGYGQLAWKVRNDPRVVSIERTNFRSIDPKLIPEPVDIMVADVSFISLTIILPAATPFLHAGSAIVTLVKPQFEAGKELVGKGGIVRDPRGHALAIERVTDTARSLGWTHLGTIESPITGADGNHEFLAAFRV